MRTTKGKPTWGRVDLGDSDLAKKLGDALAFEERTERHTHGFHTYPAGLHPDAARDMLALFEGPRVLDPFCGGGTVLVEVRAAGRTAVGRDISPVALRVAKARTATPSDEVLTAMRSRARKLTAAAREAKAEPPAAILDKVRQWYAPHVRHELECIRAGIAEVEDPVVHDLLEVVFSSILVKVSWRRSDTNATRVTHDRPEGTTAVLFHKKVRELGRKLAAYRDAVPDGTPEADIDARDARKLQMSPVDLVLTSPPYPSTYDYLPMQQLRSIWLGDDRDVGSEIGARRHFRGGVRKARKRWKQDTNAWMKSAASVIKPGGHMVIVIGDGLHPAGPVDTSAPTEEGARAAGLESVARSSLERPDHARGGGRWEHVFAFRKPRREP